MPNKRYHIHLICAPDDQVRMLDGLAVFMQEKAFLTRDLSETGDHASKYSRQCIDSCDFLIMLVGDSYGALANTGVSQMHLSYIYAKTKSKPMMFIVKLHSNSEHLQRQLVDLIANIEEEYSESIYYYDEDIEMQKYIAPAYRKFVSENVTTNKSARGWIPAPKTRSKKQVISVNKTQTTSQQAQLEKELGFIDNAFHDDVNAEFQVNFVTHAYQDGNLSEVSLKITLTWLKILQTIDKLPAPIGKSTFQRAINEIIHQRALQLVQLRQPNVHAVSRTSILANDLNWMHTQLVEFGWLIKKDNKSSVNKRSSIEVIQLSHKGQLASRSM